jgi:hypothetical protein
VQTANERRNRASEPVALPQTTIELGVAAKERRWMDWGWVGDEDGLMRLEREKEGAGAGEGRSADWQEWQVGKREHESDKPDQRKPALWPHTRPGHFVNRQNRPVHSPLTSPPSPSPYSLPSVISPIINLPKCACISQFHLGRLSQPFLLGLPPSARPRRPPQHTRLWHICNAYLGAARSSSSGKNIVSRFVCHWPMYASAGPPCRHLRAAKILYTCMSLYIKFCRHSCFNAAFMCPFKQNTSRLCA